MDNTKPGGLAWVAVEVVVFTILEAHLAVLLVPAPEQPGVWQLPAGPLCDGPAAEGAARRALAAALHGDGIWLEQLYTFADRTEGGATARITYLALVNAQQVTPAGDARWWNIALAPPRLEPARRSIEYAVQRVRSKLEYTTVGFQLLPPRFTLSELQRIYEIILDRTLDKRNFRRRVDVLGIVKPTRERRVTGTGRPAQLYRFAGTDAAPLEVASPDPATSAPVVGVARVVPRIRKGNRRVATRGSDLGGAA